MQKIKQLVAEAPDGGAPCCGTIGTIGNPVLADLRNAHNQDVKLFHINCFTSIVSDKWISCFHASVTWQYLYVIPRCEIVVLSSKLLACDFISLLSFTSRPFTRDLIRATLLWYTFYGRGFEVCDSL